MIALIVIDIIQSLQLMLKCMRSGVDLYIKRLRSRLCFIQCGIVIFFMKLAHKLNDVDRQNYQQFFSDRKLFPYR